MMASKNKDESSQHEAQDVGREIQQPVPKALLPDYVEPTDRPEDNGTGYYCVYCGREICATCGCCTCWPAPEKCFHDEDFRKDSKGRTYHYRSKVVIVCESCGESFNGMAGFRGHTCKGGGPE